MIEDNIREMIARVAAPVAFFVRGMIITRRYADPDPAQAKKAQRPMVSYATPARIDWQPAHDRIRRR
jgi:hypothetical protein